VDLPTFGRPTMATEKVMRTLGQPARFERKGLYAPPKLQTQPAGGSEGRNSSEVCNIGRQRGVGGSGHAVPCC
jgi:hypothetical protein